MNAIFKKRQLDFTLKIILFSGILFGVHSYLFAHFFEHTLFFPIWQVYLFLLVVTFLIFTSINYRYANGNTSIFNLFLMSTLLKMFLAVIFLLPLLLSDIENKKTDVINFFIPYFLFLFFEVFTITTFLQKNE